MNPYLPNAPYAADAAMLGLPISTPMTGNPSEGNVLLASVRLLGRAAVLSASADPAQHAEPLIQPWDRVHLLLTTVKRALDVMQIENMAYPVTVDAIHTVFSPYGFVQKIAIFEKNNGWQVLWVTVQSWATVTVMPSFAYANHHSCLWHAGTSTVSRPSQRQQCEAGVGGPRNL